MLVSLLFVLTGLATGLQVYYSLSWAIWGAPVQPYQYMAFIGPAVLGVAAIFSPRRRRTAGLLGLVGSVRLWIWYKPALYAVWVNPPVPFRFRVAFVPILFLVFATVLSIIMIVRREIPAR